MKNRYEVLQEGNEDNEKMVMQEVPKGRSKSTELEIEDPSREETKPQKERVEGGGIREDMDLGEMDLIGIEKACENLKDG